MREETSVPALLVNAVERRGSAAAIMEKVLGRWLSFTWAEYLAKAKAAGAGFAELGVSPGDAVLVIADNSPKWVFCDLGIQAAGGFTVGLFATTPAGELAYILEDCGARVVVVGDQEQADKVLDVIEEAGSSRVEKVVYIDTKGVELYEEEILVSYDQLEERGRAILAEDPARFDRMLDEVGLDDVALVGYTSGTTGLPKGVMITHRNMVEVTKSYESAFEMSGHDRIVAWVAVAHPAIRGPQVYTPYRNGAVLAFPESSDTFQEALYEIAPTYIMCPPRYLELMSADVRIRMAKSTRIKRWLYRLGMRLGERAANRKLARAGKVDLIVRTYRALSWTLVGKSVLEKMGLDRIRWPLAGGAAISAQLLNFYHSLGLELRQVYGQAETAGVPFAQYGRAVRPGTVGRELAGYESRLNDEGELLVRGPGVFLGYLGKPEQTAEVLDDERWFNTGDLADFTEDGELVLLDRESAIMTLADGTRLAPTEVENGLKFSPYISEAVLIAQERPYPTALIQIELGTVSEWAQQKQLPYTTFRSLTELEEVSELIRSEISDINRTLEEEQRVRDFRLLPKELDIDDDELTPTRKVKRRVIDDKYGDLIGAMYEKEPAGT